MIKIAKGNFDVNIVLQEDRAVTGLARMTIDKQLFGDLEGTTQGQMLSARTDTANSAGYVAIERVTGMLHGRKGNFVLQHNGEMNRGAYSLKITVVPDSGTEELAGITGNFTINIVEKKHFYEFTYELP